MPEFSKEEQHYFFNLNDKELILLKKFSKLETKVYFILQLGYFKRKCNIINFKLCDVKHDLIFVMGLFFPNHNKPRKLISDATRLKVNNIIIKLGKYLVCSQTHKDQIRNRCNHYARLSGDPIIMFREIYNYCNLHKILPPAYSTIQDIIGQAITNEQQRLKKIIENGINKPIKKRLETMIYSTGEESLEALLKPAKNFSNKEILGEISRHVSFKHLYKKSISLIKKMDIPAETIKRYAKMIECYGPYRLKGLHNNMGYLYLICYIYCKYQTLTDNLVVCYKYLIQKIKKDANDYAKDQIVTTILHANKKLVDTSKILDLFLDAEIPDETPFGKIRTKAFSIIDKEFMSIISKHIAGKNLDLELYKWKYIKSQKFIIKNNLRPVFLTLEYYNNNANFNLKHIESFKSMLNSPNKKENLFGLKSMPAKHFNYMKNNGKLDFNLYEFNFYNSILLAIDNGNLFVKHSEDNKSLEEHLFPVKEWRQQKKQDCKRYLYTKATRRG